MSAEPINFRAVISSAWAGMLAILLAMLLVDPLRHAMAGTYTELSDTLRHDPGVAGLRVLLVMLALNTLVQVAVHVFSSRRWRGILLGLSVLYTLFFLAHQIVHLLGGEEFGLHTLLDVTHHLLGCTACWAAWRWRQFAS
jgi:hypothetical protein